jgi:hypothetical protein
MKLALGLFVFSFLLPLASEAYFTTAQSATRLTDDTMLYTVTYRFGFLNRELYMPIMAKRADGEAVKQYQAEYAILDEDDRAVTTGSSNAIVLTGDEDVTIKDGQYYLKAGKAAEFTLVALLTLPKTAQQDADLSLLVTHLPFTTVMAGTPLHAQLNPSELQYYRTPEIEL